MSDPYHAETVETPAGEYTIELYTDYDAPNPLKDYDHDGMAFFLYQTGDRAFLDSLVDAGDAGTALMSIMEKLGEYRYGGFDDEEVVRWYAKWRAITGSAWMLVSGSGNGNVQGDWWNWLVLVDTSTDWANPVEAVRDTMADYEKWAQGRYCGFVVKDPAGNDVASLWAIDDEDYALQEARDNIAYYVNERLTAANLAGAGFIGIL